MTHEEQHPACSSSSPGAPPDDAFSPDWIRRELILLATSPERLSAMATASAAHGVRDADQKMARLTRAAAAEGARR